jgi:thiamine-monophosphate kinase
MSGGGEFALIDWIRRRCRDGAAIAVGIGDDCAVLRPPAGSELLVTTDMLMDGRHFRLAAAGAEAVGYKCLAVNLSDIAAMAGRPLAAFAAVALPRDDPAGIGRGLIDGMRPLAERFGVALAGGDTNAWDGPLVVCITVIGAADPPGPVLRSGAQPGDVILVTGPLGGSLAGRHLRPTPRIEEALAIRRIAPIRAMIDLSDGLSSDVGHILEESGGLGATLEAERIPIHPDAVGESRRDGRSPLDHALNDGEDFELCLVVAPGDAGRLTAGPVAGLTLSRVGLMEREPGLRLRQGDRIGPIEPGGFDHFRGG